MIWVKRAIWVVLAVFAVMILVVVFSGGLVDDGARRSVPRSPGTLPGPTQPPSPAGEAAAPAPEPRPSAASQAEPARGSMAYDRFLPGGRQGSGEP